MGAMAGTACGLITLGRGENMIPVAPRDDEADAVLATRFWPVPNLMPELPATEARDACDVDDTVR